MELCEVLYSFTKENDDEIELKPGQIIEIISKHQDDPGWRKGILDGRVGIFPENFAAPTVPLTLCERVDSSLYLR